MVAAPVLTGPLDGHHVLGLLDHAEHRRVAARVAADPAGLLLRHVPAHGAERDPVLDLHEDLREPAYVDGVGREQVERDPLGALGTHPGQPAQLVYQVLDAPFVHKNPSRRPGPPDPSSPASPVSSTSPIASGPPSPPKPPRPPVSGPSACAA